MSLSAEVYYHPLNFSFKAGTSRGVLTEKPSWFLKLSDGKKTGWGEVSLISGLSPEKTTEIQGLFSRYIPVWETEGTKIIDELPADKPAFRFGWEQAIRDMESDEPFLLYDNDFYRGKEQIPVNGLIWMGTRKDMFDQVCRKVDEGFHCIKLKIGAMDFQEELTLLKEIRKTFSEKETELRVDANGAFSPDEATEKLKYLSEFFLHSIEQPVKPENRETLRYLSEEGAIPVALDESLIGINNRDEKRKLLEEVRPPYIILKPSLTGGFTGTSEWIELAENMNTGWWITSALESNIGLNAIAQFTNSFRPAMPQGLGTGRLFTNNIPSPLYIENGSLGYRQGKNFDLSDLREN